MGLSTTHLLLLLVVVVLLFGRNKISDLMGDVARGIKSFKKGMSEDDADAAPPKALDHAGKPVSQSERDKSTTS
jgi:sec-independent protein translocase protein TatA